MKLPKHKAEELYEEVLEDDYHLSLRNNVYLPDEVLSCSFSGTDLLSHEKEGVCFNCDFERLKKEEDKLNLDWMDKTEAWDYHDYWYQKYGEKNEK